MATYRYTNEPDVEVVEDAGVATGAMITFAAIAIIVIALLVGYFAWYSPSQSQAEPSHTVIERSSTTNTTTNPAPPAPAPVIIHDNTTVPSPYPVPVPNNPPANNPGNDNSNNRGGGSNNDNSTGG